MPWSSGVRRPLRWSPLVPQRPSRLGLSIVADRRVGSFSRQRLRDNYKSDDLIEELVVRDVEEGAARDEGDECHAQHRGELSDPSLGPGGVPTQPTCAEDARYDQTGPEDEAQDTVLSQEFHPHAVTHPDLPGPTDCELWVIAEVDVR